jgi:hypothetical protein
MNTRIHTVFAICFSLAITLATVSLTYAQSFTATTTTSDTETGSTTELQAATATLTPATPSVIRTTTPTLTPLSLEAQLRITNLAANISNRSEAYIRRLDIIAARMESRITKMEAMGYVMSDSRFYVSEARNALSNATNQLRDIDQRIYLFVSGGDYFNTWVLIRQSFTESKVHLQRAHSLLTQALEEIRITEQEEITAPTVQNTNTLEIASTTDSSAAQ